MVVRVVDGDTLLVRTRGVSERVRLLGVDTPELARAGAPGMCGSRQATSSLETLAPPGARARIATDPGTGDVRDRYGRLLAFVSVDGRDLGLAQVDRGWARVYAYRGREFSGRARFERAYASASRRGRGVHGVCRRD